MKGLKIAMLAAAVAVAPLAHALDIEPYIRKGKFDEIKISPKRGGDREVTSPR